MFNLCNLLRWQFRCLTNVVVVVIIDCMDETQGFSLTFVSCCFFKVPWKHFSFIFLLRHEEDITGSSRFIRNDPPSITFSQIWKKGFCSKSTRVLVGFCSKTWTRDALKVDNKSFFDKTCLGFRSCYMWRIMRGIFFKSGVYRFLQLFIYVTLDHKTSLRSLGYICSNSQKYIVWVTIIDLSFMPKIIRILRSCSLKIFCKCLTVNISKLHFWLVICIAKNFIWTTLKVIFSIFRFFLQPQISK